MLEVRCECRACKLLDRKWPLDGYQLMLFPPEPPPFPYIWFWRCRLGERKGQRCRVLARGKMNSILVEFEDGWTVITARYAVRLVKP